MLDVQSAFNDASIKYIIQLMKKKEIPKCLIVAVEKPT